MRVYRVLPYLVLGLLLPGLGQAQTSVQLPDAGSILREVDLMVRPAVPVVPALVAPQAHAPVAEDELVFVVERFDVRGIRLIPPIEIDEVLAPWRNRDITFADLEDAMAAIADHYQRSGWYARPQLPAQDIVDNTIVVNVIEGRLGEIILADPDALPIPEEHIFGYLTHRQPTGNYLSIRELNRSIQILSERHGFVTSVALSPSDTEASTDLLVLTEPTRRFDGSVVFDNTGSRTTGAERAFITTHLNNPFGSGDRIQLSILRTPGVGFVRVGYEQPVGYGGWSWNFDASLMRYRVLQAFTELDAGGRSRTLSTGASYAWLRSEGANTTFNATVQRSQSENESGGDITSSNQTDSLRLNLSGDWADGYGAGAANVWSVAAVLGQLELDADNRAADRTSARTHGAFSKLTWSLSRLQRINSLNNLWLSANGQLTGQNLGSGEQFSLGGPQGVRAYPASEGSGDLGFIATIEWRHTLTSEVQLNYFLDYGHIRTRFDNRRTNDSPNRYSLAGHGASINYTLPGQLSTSLTWARREGSNPNANAEGLDNDGSLSRNRFWLQLTRQF